MLHSVLIKAVGLCKYREQWQKVQNFVILFFPLTDMSYLYKYIALLSAKLLCHVSAGLFLNIFIFFVILTSSKH